ncbi:MAG: hypothetical protein AAGF95_24045 [Chloroflexota bacterium]
MNQVRHSADFQIQQPAAILFPLFSAEGEKLWVPGWDYKNVMGKTDLHEDYIFITENHDHAASDAIWLVKRYEPSEYLIEFYKVEPEEKVGIITVKCSVLSEVKTKVSVTYEYISLSEKGNEFVRNFTSEEYKQFISEWHKLLEAYFAREHSYQV